MKYVLGIDVGTGSVKAVAVNLQCESFETSQQYYSFSSTKPGYHEQDPEQIWEAFLACIKDVIHKIGSQPMAISLSSAMHSLLAVDNDCKPLSLMMTWADSRSSDIAQRLQHSAEGLAIYMDTGTPLHAMSPLCKLIWIKENQPDLLEKAYKFISIKEYLWHKLFQEYKVDYSIASCTGLFDINKLSWHQNALALIGIDELVLSEPVPTDYTKEFRTEHQNSELKFLQAGVQFTIGASDGCLANLASMANKPGVAVMTIGTSGAIRIASKRSLPNEKSMPFSYILDRETFICGGPINNGGIALQWWLKNITQGKPTEDSYDELFKQVGEVPAGSEGLIFLPYLTGERAPIWDSKSCGTFFGIKLQHGQEHFSRAVLEGICYAMKDVLDTVQQNAEPITQINISGGFVKSDIWVQTLADITEKKLVVVQTEDASSVGAAFLSMKALKLIQEYPTSNYSNLKTIKPNPVNSEIYSKNFTIFKLLYSNLKETMHQFYLMNN